MSMVIDVDNAERIKKLIEFIEKYGKPFQQGELLKDHIIKELKDGLAAYKEIQTEGLSTKEMYELESIQKKAIQTFSEISTAVIEANEEFGWKKRVDEMGFFYIESYSEYSNRKSKYPCFRAKTPDYEGVSKTPVLSFVTERIPYKPYDEDYRF